MRCGQAKSRFCLFLRFGVVKLLSSDFSRTSLRPSRISVFSWGIRGKPWVTTSTTEKRAKCLSLGMVSSLIKSFSVEESVGARCSSKKFERNRLVASRQKPWRSSRSWQLRRQQHLYYEDRQDYEVFVMCYC